MLADEKGALPDLRHSEIGCIELRYMYQIAKLRCAKRELPKERRTVLRQKAAHVFHQEETGADLLDHPEKLEDQAVAGILSAAAPLKRKALAGRPTGEESAIAGRQSGSRKQIASGNLFK
jgi:hypothetical protein